MHAGLHAAGATGEDERQAVVLVRVRLGVLVRKHDAGVIEQRPVPFRHCLHPPQQIREFLDVPAADVAHDALTFGRFRVGVRVVVMTQARVAEPWEPHQALTLGQHV